MSIIKGLLKNKNGDILHLETSSDKVVRSDNTTVEAALTNLEGFKTTIFDAANSKLLMSVMPDILQHNKGTFANKAAIEAGVANPAAGDYCINTETDTVWIYDAETSAWVDSDRKGQVVSVNGKTGEVVIGIAEIDGLQALLDEKVKTADVIDNLTSTETAKPLSANQGSVLKGLVDAAQSTADEIDFAVVANGASAPAALRADGMYVELDA